MFFQVLIVQLVHIIVYEISKLIPDDDQLLYALQQTYSRASDLSLNDIIGFINIMSF